MHGTAESTADDWSLRARRSGLDIALTIVVFLAIAAIAAGVALGW
jgi:hypothetical protein